MVKFWSADRVKPCRGFTELINIEIPKAERCDPIRFGKRIPVVDRTVDKLSLARLYRCNQPISSPPIDFGNRRVEGSCFIRKNRPSVGPSYVTLQVRFIPRFLWFTDWAYPQYGFDSQYASVSFADVLYSTLNIDRTLYSRLIPDKFRIDHSQPCSVSTHSAFVGITSRVSSYFGSFQSSIGPTSADYREHRKQCLQANTRVVPAVLMRRGIADVLHRYAVGFIALGIVGGWWVGFYGAILCVDGRRMMGRIALVVRLTLFLQTVLTIASCSSTDDYKHEQGNTTMFHDAAV